MRGGGPGGGPDCIVDDEYLPRNRQSVRLNEDPL